MTSKFRLNWGKGAKQRVELLLLAGRGINDPTDNYGYSFLHHAVNVEKNAEANIYDESEALIRFLILNGANLESRDCCGRTPLMLAVSSYNTRAVQVLLDEGSSVSSYCDFQKSVLHYTVSNVQANIAKMLVERGANVDVVDSFGLTPLQDALECGNDLLVKYLSQLDYPSVILNSISHYQYKLVRHAFWGQNNEIRIILSKDVNIDSSDGYGNTSLIVAVRSGKFNTVQLLLKAGANIESKDILGYTALHWACKQTLPDIVKLLLQHGADPNAKSKDSLTPLDCAIEGMSKSILGQIQQPSAVISHLLDYGTIMYAGPNYPDYDKGENPYFEERNKVSEASMHRQSERDDIENLSCFERQILSHDLRLRIADISPFRNIFEMRDIEITFFKWDCSLKRSPHFRSRCIQEIALMKTTFIGDVSLFQFVSSPKATFNCKITNKTVKKLLESDKYADNLPIYWGMIEAKLMRLKMRQSLMESSFTFFSFIKPLLPYDCVDIILTYLSSKDMEILKQIAFKFELKAIYQGS